MADLTQQDLEAAELACERARQHFLDELAASPKAFAAWTAYQQRERDVFEARRARRESEVHE